MPVETEPSVKVWARVEYCLAKAHWTIQEQFRILKRHLTTYGGNPDLLLVHFASSGGGTLNGVYLPNWNTEASGANVRVHGLFVRKGDDMRPDQDPEDPDPPVPDVDVYFSLTEYDTGMGPGETTGGKADFMVPLIGVGATACAIFAEGLACSDGFNVGASRYPTGESSPLAVPKEHGVYGFAVVSRVGGLAYGNHN